MTRRAVLNNVDHHDLRVIPAHGGGDSARVNQITVFPTEFEAIQREYPILFQKGEDGAFQAVALLGLDRDENLFLEGERWTTRYVPALQRRGPFSIGLQARDDGTPPEPMIHVDLDDPAVSNEGQPLFLQHGGNSPYLEQVAEVLRTIYAGVELAPPMFAAFQAAGLIQPIALEIMLSDDKRYTLPDYWTIAQDRLAGLDGATLEQLNRNGFLQLAWFAAASLGNVPQLIALKNAKR